MRIVGRLYFCFILVYICRGWMIWLYFFLLRECLFSYRHIPDLMTFIYAWSLRPNLAAATQLSSKTFWWARMCSINEFYNYTSIFLI
jgi:hypothetical protein